MRVALAGLLCALAFVQGCSSYRVHRDERWHQNGPPWGVFDVYEPGFDAGARRPAILAIHGGAWMIGDKRGLGEDVARVFCPRGYVVFSMNYRLAPEHRWPQQLRDCQAALRHIRGRAGALGIDPARIAAFGVSAGGHLATMLALREDPEDAGPHKGRVAAAVDANGDADLTIEEGIENQKAILAAVLGPPPWPKVVLADISTVTFARRDASVLIIHGAGDTNVKVVHSDRLHAALRAAGADVEYVRLEGDEGECHGNCWKRTAALDAMKEFLDRKLVPEGK